MGGPLSWPLPPMMLLFPDLLLLRPRLRRCLTPRLSITGIIRADTGVEGLLGLGASIRLMKKMKCGVIGPLAGSCAAPDPLSWTTPVATVVMGTPGGGPGPQRERPMAASTGSTPLAPRGLALEMLGGVPPLSLLQVTL